MMKVDSKEYQTYVSKVQSFNKSCFAVGELVRRKKRLVLILNPDRSVKRMEKMGLKHFNSVVGGFIEYVRCPMFPDYVMIVNEEGLLKGLPENLLASALAVGRIVGPAILMPAALAREEH